MTAWNDFVKKIYHEGHNKDSNYSFKQALQDASKRKGEMNTSLSSNPFPKRTKKMRKSKSSKSMKSRKSKKSRKSRKSRKH
jgi:hypothetical protein